MTYSLQSLRITIVGTGNDIDSYFLALGDRLIGDGSAGLQVPNLDGGNTQTQPLPPESPALNGRRNLDSLTSNRWTQSEKLALPMSADTRCKMQSSNLVVRIDREHCGLPVPVFCPQQSIPLLVRGGL